MFRFSYYDEIEELRGMSHGICYKGRHVDNNTYHFIKERMPSYDAIAENEKNILLELKEVPYVSRLYDFSIKEESIYNTDKKSYIVTEYVEGYSLDELVQKVNLADDEIMRIGGKLASILKTINGMGIYHCDIKLSNVRLDYEDNIYLLDFETARKKEDLDKGIHIHDMGTSPYTTSMESVKSENVDKYAFGKLLYRMITRCDFNTLAQLNLGSAVNELENLKTDRNLSYCVLACIAMEDSVSMANIEDVLKKQKVIGLADYVRLLEKICTSIPPRSVKIFSPIVNPAMERTVPQTIMPQMPMPQMETPQMAPQAIPQETLQDAPKYMEPDYRTLLLTEDYMG